MSKFDETMKGSFPTPAWRTKKIYRYMYLEQMVKVKLKLSEEQSSSVTKLKNAIRNLEEESELPILLFSASRKTEQALGTLYEHQLIYYLPDLEIIKDDQIHDHREYELYIRKNTLDLRKAFENYGFPKDAPDPLDVSDGLFNYQNPNMTISSLRVTLDKQYIVNQTASSIKAVIDHLFRNEEIESWTHLRNRLTSYYFGDDDP